jgi:uncharacterized membrane protein
MASHRRRSPQLSQVTSPSGDALVAPEEPKYMVSLSRFEAEFFEGPLPHPETLAHYESIYPGAADRIFGMAELQSRHRQDLEKLVITSNCRAQDRGPIFGFTLAAGVIGLGAYLILQGKEVSGLVALVAALVAMVVPFVYGKREQRRELREKREDLLPGEREPKPPKTGKSSR